MAAVRTHLLRLTKAVPAALLVAVLTLLFSAPLVAADGPPDPAIDLVHKLTGNSPQLQLNASLPQTAPLPFGLGPIFGPPITEGICTETPRGQTCLSAIIGNSICANAVLAGANLDVVVTGQVYVEAGLNGSPGGCAGYSQGCC
jgi:hypothetical protein